MANKRVDEPTGTETVGHEWDGIEELNTPLPRWWLYTFYACILFSIGYVVVYPAIPGVHASSAGLWHWSSRGQLAGEMNKEQARRAPMLAALAAVPIDQILKDGKLRREAIDGGAAAFKVNCIQCHGAGGGGTRGYPSLADNDWLWGGDANAIEFTIQHGVRQSADPDSRTSLMPAFGRDGILTGAQVQDVVSYVRTISGQEQQGNAARRGAALFAANCTVCHGASGEGNRGVGAPKLSDAIWLYGGDRAALTETVTNARAGQMPNWGARLDPVTIKMLAAYVHSLGGGEDVASPAPIPEPAAAPAAN